MAEQVQIVLKLDAEFKTFLNRLTVFNNRMTQERERIEKAVAEFKRLNGEML